MGARIKVVTDHGIAVQPHDDQRRLCILQRRAGSLRPGSGRACNSVEINWPSGIVQTLENVAADQVITVKEAAK